MKKASPWFSIAITIIVLSISISCKQKSSQQAKKESDTTHFFQVPQYIKSQLQEVNRTPYFIYKMDVVNGKKDSSAITTPQFINLAQTFLKPDISAPDLKKYYTENIFHDETTKTFTISYTTANKDLEVQNVDILLDEDGKTVKRIFIRKFFNDTDSSSIEQLSWKSGESFQINKLVNIDDKENTQQTIVVWNEKS